MKTNGEPLKTYKDGEPCEHPGCLNHITHPCEGCGRIGGRNQITKMKTDDEILQKNLYADRRNYLYDLPLIFRPAIFRAMDEFAKQAEAPLLAEIATARKLLKEILPMQGCIQCQEVFEPCKYHGNIKKTIEEAETFLSNTDKLFTH